MQGTYLLTLFRSSVRRALGAGWLGCRLSRRLCDRLRSGLCRRFKPGFSRSLGRWFCAGGLTLSRNFHGWLDGRRFGGVFNAGFRGGLGRSLGKTHGDTTDEKKTNADLVTHLKNQKQGT